jgi:hypothetical protein
VHERIDLAEARQHTLGERPAADALAEILVGRLGRSTTMADLGDDRVGDRGLLARAVDAHAVVVDDHRGATLGEQPRLRATKAAPGTGHEHDLRGEIDHRARR